MLNLDGFGRLRFDQDPDPWWSIGATLGLIGVLLLIALMLGY
jgi:hypothetical protein